MKITVYHGGTESGMKEINQQNDPIKSPEIQEIILSNRIGIIAANFPNV